MQLSSAGAVTHLLFQVAKTIKIHFQTVNAWNESWVTRRSERTSALRLSHCVWGVLGARTLGRLLVLRNTIPAHPCRVDLVTSHQETLKHVRKGAIRSFFCGVPTHIPRHGGFWSFPRKVCHLKTKQKKDIWFRSGESLVQPKGTVIRQNHKMYPVHEAMCS